ncbi:SDR family NAD(P)-dependent oxidoreductase [Streptomyces sp. NPDC058440]|uniref:SDR family NAD(P)-dependent oxidoreductase n=1 Tax=Streptomyces sp. NPDC058440 TaxID=3346501 RepID=UPI003660881A
MVSRKTWFITGAGRGFGLQWARAALSRGDRVAATARDVAALEGLSSEFGNAVLPLALDITHREDVFAAVQQAHAHFGRLDIVLSNAGSGLMGAVEEVDMDMVRAAFDVNVFGTLSVVQAALPLLRAQGSGHIIGVSSVAGVVAVPTAGIYEGTKFAVEGIFEALAAEVADFGIHVTLLEPGAYATDFFSTGSLATAPALPEYDPLRERLDSMTMESLGDPAATAPVLLKVVDAEKPPLRIILGDLFPLVRETYDKRIKTWEEWQDESLAALGRDAKQLAPQSGEKA